MNNNYNLERFIEAQRRNYENALSEIKKGKKQSHWMWYIFPQVKGLGFTSTSNYYSIIDLNEADAYLQHEILGKRLIQICNELLLLKSNNAREIFGTPDDMKLKSSMTLFASLENADPVFETVLQKFFKGDKDQKTINIIGS